MSGKSVLWLTVGGRQTASSRVRAFDVSAELVARGLTSDVVVASGFRGRASAVWALAHRRWDIVVLQKLLYGRVMLALARMRASILVFECDDAVHLGYPGEDAGRVRRTQKRLTRLRASVDVVTTSNPLLAADLMPASGRTLCAPGPSPRRGTTPHERPNVLVWLGSPSTSSHLELLGSLPAQLEREGWTCVAVGADPATARDGWHVIPWSPEDATWWLGRASVGVVPQRASAWDDRKAAYKLLEYAAAGVVPVASDVLPARLLLDGAVLEQLLVRDCDGWREAIEAASAASKRWPTALDDLVKRHSLDSWVDNWLATMNETPAT